jgi:hypothetical protein
MKRFFILLTAGWFLFSTSSQGAETAQARLYCLSLRFQQGTTYGGTLSLSSTGGSPYNGELLPTFGDSSGNPWGSYFFLYYGGYGTIPGTIYVSLPSPVDANNDRFDDFFEVSQGVSTKSTSGSESTSVSSGTVTATWSRPAGSPNGTCQLHFVDDTYGDLGTYNCPFTLIEYTGPLTYTPGSNTVSAAINLTQTGNSANTLRGPVNFIKSSTDRFNTLTNQPGVWTNAALQTLSFDSEVFARYIPTWPTNYAGYVFFGDGDPSTASPDYQVWVLSINDTNDANANGVPDFSDNPASVTPPRAPHLSLVLGPTNLWLTVGGSIGHTNQIQQIASLSTTNWQTLSSFLQTNDPQVVSLPLPAATPKFWRVVAQ